MLLASIHFSKGEGIVSEAMSEFQPVKYSDVFSHCDRETEVNLCSCCKP